MFRSVLENLMARGVLSEEEVEQLKEESHDIKEDYSNLIRTLSS